MPRQAILCGPPSTPWPRVLPSIRHRLAYRHCAGRLLTNGAFYTFPHIAGLFGRRAKGQPLLTSADVVSYLLEVAGVALVPGDAFGDDRSMRLSYASSVAELEEGLARIDRAVQQLE